MFDLNNYLSICSKTILVQTDRQISRWTVDIGRDETIPIHNIQCRQNTVGHLYSQKNLKLRFSDNEGMIVFSYWLSMECMAYPFLIFFDTTVFFRGEVRGSRSAGETFDPKKCNPGQFK